MASVGPGHRLLESPMPPLTALVEKIATLIAMRKRDDARLAIDQYRRTVRSGTQRADVDRLEEELR